MKFIYLKLRSDGFVDKIKIDIPYSDVLQSNDLKNIYAQFYYDFYSDAGVLEMELSNTWYDDAQVLKEMLDDPECYQDVLRKDFAEYIEDL